MKRPSPFPQHGSRPACGRARSSNPTRRHPWATRRGMSFVALLLALTAAGCDATARHDHRCDGVATKPAARDSVSRDTSQAVESRAAEKFSPVAEADTTPRYTESEQRMLDFGLVDLASLNDTIAVDLRYADSDNFLHQPLYPDIHHAFLLPSLAAKLCEAQRRLSAEHPGLHLLIFDAARPMSAHRRMWRQAVSLGANAYVANPSKGGGLHNYGAAVDLTLADENGTVDMGTDFDYFGVEAHIGHEAELLRQGKLSTTAYDNRRLLRKTMQSVGLRPCPTEWWHFNLVSREQAQAELPLLDW